MDGLAPSMKNESARSMVPKRDDVALRMQRKRIADLPGDEPGDEFELRLGQRLAGRRADIRIAS